MLNKSFTIIITVILTMSVLSCAMNDANHDSSPSAKNDTPLDSALVGHWSFDEQQGDTVYDRSPYDAHGIIKGNPERDEGIVGQNALEFDGQGDYVEILENDQTPSHIRELGKGSISIWFSARNIPVGSSILPVLYYGNENGCPNMFDASNEGLIIEIAHGSVFPEARGVFFTIFSNSCQLPSFCYDSHSDVHMQDKQGAIREKQWYHYVAVVGEDGNTGYLNGKEIHYRSYNFSGSGASQFFKDALEHKRMWIGKGFWDHAQDVYFDGYMDDVRIYNKPLSKREVKKLYNMKDES